MSELNFCPNCNAPQHKVLYCANDVFFCKECSEFFQYKDVTLQCPKCDSDQITTSDFPSPDGDVVFQCKKCNKALSAKEFLKANKIGK